MAENEIPISGLPGRELILRKAIAKFASHDYANASITKIIKEAKIAKGSFYQYFEDKKKLYLYLFDLANREKLAFLQEANPPQSSDEIFSLSALVV